MPPRPAGQRPEPENNGVSHKKCLTAANVR